MFFVQLALRAGPDDLFIVYCDQERTPRLEIESNHKFPIMNGEIFSLNTTIESGCIFCQK